MNLGARGDGSRRFAGYPCALGPSGDPRLGQAPDTEQGEDGRDKGRHTGLGGRSQAREVALLPCGNSESLKMREMCTITASPPPERVFRLRSTTALASQAGSPRPLLSLLLG